MNQQTEIALIKMTAEMVKRIKDLLQSRQYHQHQIAAIVEVNQGHKGEKRFASLSRPDLALADSIFTKLGGDQITYNVSNDSICSTHQNQAFFPALRRLS